MYQITHRLNPRTGVRMNSHILYRGCLSSLEPGFILSFNASLYRIIVIDVNGILFYGRVFKCQTKVIFRQRFTCIGQCEQYNIRKTLTTARYWRH